MNRNTWAAAAATVVVVVAIVLGLRDLGGPANQRMVQADLRAVQALGTLAQQIQTSWSNSGRVLPPNLDTFPRSMAQNAVTNRPFAYHPKSGSAYELCATFATASPNPPNQNTPDGWAHPKGNHCFQLDAAQPVPQVPYFY